MRTHLEIDLNSQSIERHEKDGEDVVRAGRYLIAKTLLDRGLAEVDPLSPENPLIFSAGPFAGSNFSNANRLSVGCKSPLTGGIKEANSGGTFAFGQLELSGLTLNGASDEWVVIRITKDGNITFEDASPYLGKGNMESAALLFEKYGDKVSLGLCGPVGEYQGLMSGISFTDPEQRPTRLAARGGVGAVMGSKNLKAIAVSGSGALQVAEPEAFMAESLAMQRYLMGVDTTKNLRNFGTSTSFEAWNKLGSIPVRNYQATQIDLDEADAIATAVKEKHYIEKAFGCFACPVMCSQYQRVKSGPHAGTRGEKVESQDYWDFGGKLGISDPAAVLALSEHCTQLGLDNTNATNPIAWALECYQRGLLTTDDTDGLELAWGDVEVISQLLTKIAYREGIGDLLADGSLAAAERLGRNSERFAMHMKGQDLAEEMRVFKGWALAIAVAERGGTHTQGGPLTERMPLQPELSMQRFGVPTAFDPTSYEHKAELVIYYQRFHNLLEITGICFYATYWCGLQMMGPDEVARLYSLATGDNKTADELMTEGEKILYLQKAFNMRHTTFDRASDYPPERFMNEPATGPHAGERLERPDWDRLLDEYYGQRGWDLASGKPTAENFRAVGLPELA